jgi:hypothetical protein
MLRSINAVLRRSPDETFNYSMDDDPGDGRSTRAANCRKRAVTFDDATQDNAAAARAATHTRASVQDAASTASTRAAGAADSAASG